MNNLDDTFVYSCFLTFLFIDSCFILGTIHGAIVCVKDYFKRRKNRSDVGGGVSE